MPKQAGRKLDEWMPLYIGRYLGDTMHLTYDQHGAYLLLLMHYWRKGPLPDDDRQLAAIAKVPTKLWRGMAGIIRAFFTREDDGNLHQKKADEERGRRQEISGKRSTAGKVGADVTNGQKQQVSAQPGAANADLLPDVCRPVAAPQLQLQEQEQEGSKPLPPSAVGGAPTRASHGSRLPADWRPSPEGVQLATDLAIDLEAVLATFRDYWLAEPGQKGRKADWEATWRNWCRRHAERHAAGRPGAGGPSLPLLRTIDGGKPPNPGDAWGIDAWCRSIGAEPITNPEHLKRGKWMHSGCIIDSIARNVAEAAGFGRTLRIDWTPLLGWLQAGCSPSEHIYPAVRAAADYFRGRGDPATNLKVFEQSVTRRRVA